MLVLLFAAAFQHVYVEGHQPEPFFWGDEPHYLQAAFEDAERGDTSLLPGRLRFAHRPELVSRVYALFCARSDTPYPAIQTFQLVLFLALLVLTFLQAKVLGLGDAAAAFATGVLAFFPWFGFHVHSLWPEVLHAFLFAVVLLSLLLYVRSLRIAWLVPAGLATAYALLAKGVLGPFVPFIALYLGWVTYREREGLAPARRVLRAVAAGGGYALLVLLVLAPQLARNAADGHGLRLSANRWWNLELGLTLPVEAVTGGPWEHYVRTNNAYYLAADDPVEREQHARERTLDFVGETGVFALIGRQARKLVHLFLSGESSLEQSVWRGRWGTAAPAWITGLLGPARIYWYGLLALAGVGFAMSLPLVVERDRDDEGWVFLVLFTALFLAVLFVVPVKIRFAMPLVPVLALFSAVGVERIAHRLEVARQR